jgi:hypothetical protein
MPVELPQTSATAGTQAVGPNRLWRSYETALRWLWPAAEAGGEAAVPQPSFEQKFLFTPYHLAFVREHLARVLRPDPSYDEGQITSIYYDTPNLDFYWEKRASEYLKTKVRLRWYGRIAPSEEEQNCFLEVKTKVGGTRQKIRYDMSLPKNALLSYDLSAPALRAATAVLLQHDDVLPQPLLPMIVVQYHRQRYVDPLTHARIALDTNIWCPAVNQLFIPGLPPVPVEGCVLEVKGSERDLQSWMGPIKRYVQRDAFSKYASCLERLLQPTGRRE